jgi:DNA-binding beta-propeller fold protein YncE
VRSLVGALLVAAASAQVVTSSTHVGSAVDAAPRTSGPCLDQPALVPAFELARDLTLFPGLYGCVAPSPGPWSVAWAPGGGLYASFFGGAIGSSNCLVARLDPGTLAPTLLIPVGAGPQEIVFTETSGGTLARGFVTNSSGSSVSVFDAAHQVVATIPIPTTSPWGTAFPFGMAVAPDGARVYVGTSDGSGKVFAIDTGTLTLVPAETLSFGAGKGFGRMLFAGGTLVLTMTTFDPGFTGSTAHVVFVEPAHPRRATVRTLMGVHDGSAFPNPIDAALFCGMQVFVSGYDMGPQVFVFDVATRQLVEVVPTGTSQAQGKLHGLAIGPNGLGAVTDFIADEIAWFDASTRGVLGVTDLSLVPGWHTNANEVVFAPDGQSLIVVGEGSSSLVRFALP